MPSPNIENVRCCDAIKVTVTEGSFNMLGDRIWRISSSSCVSVSPAASTTPTSGIDTFPVSVTT